MEATGSSLYELSKRFTRSEQVLAGWRGGELAANMQAARVEPPRQTQAGYSQSSVEGGWSNEQLDLLESRIGSFADKMVDERGEIDLRRLTGDEVVRYMSALGMAARRR